MKFLYLFFCSIAFARFGFLPDNLGDHKATKTLDLQHHDIIQVSSISAQLGRFIDTIEPRYLVYTILLRETIGSGIDETTSTTWEDKLDVSANWNKFISSESVISARAYIYFLLASTSTTSFVSGRSYVTIGGIRYYSPERIIATPSSTDWQEFKEIIEIPATAFSDELHPGLNVGMQIRSTTNQFVYYQLHRCFLVVKTKEE